MLAADGGADERISLPFHVDRFNPLLACHDRSLELLMVGLCPGQAAVDPCQCFSVISSITPAPYRDRAHPNHDVQDSTADDKTVRAPRPPAKIHQAQPPVRHNSAGEQDQQPASQTRTATLTTSKDAGHP
jgi:hypothetical protein